MTDSGPAQLVISRHAARDVPPMRDELLAVHCDARAELLDQPFYSAARFWERFEAYLRGAGFVLVAGWIDDQLIGYAFGGPLPADTRWWTGVEASEQDLTRETGSRTFAFRELLVRKAYQRRGHGRRLHDALLADRSEERATLLVRQDNPARQLYLGWGWTLAGRLQPFPDSPRFDSLVLPIKTQGEVRIC